MSIYENDDFDDHEPECELTIHDNGDCPEGYDCSHHECTCHEIQEARAEAAADAAYDAEVEDALL